MMRVDWFGDVRGKHPVPRKIWFLPKVVSRLSGKGLGKSARLEAFNKLSYLPFLALRATAVAIIRIFDRGFGALLLDEVDNMNLD